MIRKIELFLRGEYWLHLVTMFLFTSLLLKFVEILNIKGGVPLTLLTVIIVPVGWEYYWHKKRGNTINRKDILYSILGGILSIILNL